MNNKLLILVVAVVAAAAVIGTGFAVTYTATTISNSNTAHYSGNTVEIVDVSGNPVTTPLRIAGPTPDIGGNTTVINSRLKVNTEDTTGLYVRCWVQMQDARSWIIVNSMTISIDGGEAKEFIKNGTSSILSDAMLLTPGIHTFTFTISYKNLADVSILDGENTDFLDLTGSTLRFYAGDTDPIPTGS